MHTRTFQKFFLIILITCIMIAMIVYQGAAKENDGNSRPPACTVPTTVAMNGRDVELDQCYVHEFDYEGETYTVRVFYTEDPTIQDEVNGVVQCDDDDAPSLCEHALPDCDVGDVLANCFDDTPTQNFDTTNDNLLAIQVAEQVEIVMPYYFDRNFPVIGDNTDIQIQLGEDTENGWVIAPNIIYLDDEYIATDSITKVRANVFHESQHLIQEKYNDDVGWQQWYTEGIARTSQDRTDADYDAATNGAYLTDFNRILQNWNGVRSNDLLAAKYRGAAWWTWIMDQYATPAEQEPGLGWNAIRDFYLILDNETNHSLDAVEDYLSGEGSSFEEDFIDYTLALYAYKFNPTDPRLGFIDAEINSATNGLTNHTVITTAPEFGFNLVVTQPRSSQYWEYKPANQCDYVTFSFNENNASEYAFSVLTVDSGGTLQDRWTSRSPEWSRTVHTTGLSRLLGVVTALDGNPDSAMSLSHGCVEPDIEIKNPTTGAPAFVGEADNPRGFLIRLAVTGEDDSGIAGLTKDDFSVELEPSSGPAIEADIINAMYVQDNYWLFVTPPDDSDGAQTGQYYDLTVTLGTDSDTQNNAILYVERRVDKLIVLDQSGSMANSNRINAARNAAVLMTYELTGTDQGAYVRFNQDANLDDMLTSMDIVQTFSMANNIMTTNPIGNTSIGDGLKTAAAEEDARGDDEHVCWIVLLSDGYENAEDYWADVEAQVTNNECYMDVVGFGPTANEALLQQIAASSIGGGFYDFAPVSGDVPIDNSPASRANNHAPVTSNLSWQNYLSRIYDAKSIRAAGRQRILSGAGNNQDNPSGIIYPIQVDPTTDELVVSIAWQTPVTSPFIRLLNPNGVEISLDHQTVANTFTAEIWRVPNPMAGEWELVVNQVFQQFHVSASARTLLEMHLFAGVPQDNPLQGVKVPILVTFGGQGEPITGADVLATVTNPGGVQKDVFLYDDGNHGDMLANDGVYGNWYTQTTVGETSVEDPTNVIEGAEPQSRGSYLVEAQAKWEGLRRESQTSFFVVEAEDADDDRIPDWWEEENGMDPTDPNDGDDDPDGDNLPNNCEWNQGTNPNNPDTDGGGESDGSEVPNCVPGEKDPLNPTDDGVKPIRAFLTTPQVSAAGQPYVELAFAGLPETPIQTVDIYRRKANDSEAPWFLIKDDFVPASDGVFYRDIVNPAAPAQQYRVVPSFAGSGDMHAGGAVVIGGSLDSGVVNISSDPYAPVGSIVIQEGQTTSTRAVTLLLAAEDNGHNHGADPDSATPPPGTPSSQLMMRVSTHPEFVGAPWQSYQSLINGFDLGNVQNGDYVDVYVQYKDEAGNISDVSEPQIATVQYITAPWIQLFLPVIKH